ncbi:putative beta-caryophyllene synthase-like [Capsicum annuum]|nr:putative beta-caryophyllene synthase-like [Capsicum annuum]
MELCTQTIVADEVKITRRSGNHHPTIWGNHFLAYADLSVANEEEEKQHDDLKEEVRKMLVMMAPSKYLQKLDLINTIQRLGIAYHFEREIEESLSYMYTCYEEWIDEVDDDDLHAIAVCFRLLRQQVCVGLGKVATKDALDWLANEPPILDALCIIGRLLNDLASHEDMAQLRSHKKFKMVTKTDDFLKLWWDHISAKERKIVRTQFRHLPSLIEMDAWPEMIHVLTTFWDDQNMVFHFGDVELTPTIEEENVMEKISLFMICIIGSGDSMLFTNLGINMSQRKNGRRQEPLRLRGTRPYNPGRVLRQFEIKQETPQIDSMLRFFIEYDESEPLLKDYMIKGWRRRRWKEASFLIGYEPEVSDTYKEWLKKSLAGGLIPGPNVPTRVMDVESEHKI